MRHPCYNYYYFYYFRIRSLWYMRWRNVISRDKFIYFFVKFIRNLFLIYLPWAADDCTKNNFITIIINITSTDIVTTMIAAHHLFNRGRLIAPEGTRILNSFQLWRWMWRQAQTRALRTTCNPQPLTYIQLNKYNLISTMKKYSHFASLYLKVHKMNNFQWNVLALFR